jgi:hypothetical protein
MASVIGTPAAVPLADPKLDRMSLRTIPLCESTSGPLEPSPGYGPAVSSGISSVAVPADSVAAADAVLEVPVDGALAVVPLDDVEEAVPHATSPAAPIPNAPSIRRRLLSVPRSKPSPWSTISSSGRGSGRPS